MKKKESLERNRDRFDTELALTNDLLRTAQDLAIKCGWKVAVRALYYVLMRTSDRGRKQLAEYLSEP